MSKEKQPKDPAEQGKEIKTAADLIQDENNYRKHSETNKARIKKSIDEAGLGRSVVIDADNVLVAGNGVQQVIDKDTPVRVVETDGTELVVVKRTDLHTDDPRRKTLALADNATADDVEWDFEAIEADGWTEESALGWGVEWPNSNSGENPYSQKTDIPIYQIKGEKPSVSQCIDLFEVEKKIEKIENSNVSEDKKKMLKACAYRFAEIDFSMMAEFYAHEDEEMQSLMEDNALVIVDFDKAIELNLVKLDKRMKDIYKEECDE